jgi:hypothetical protein
VSDIVNLTWEIAQFPRLKASLITASTTRVVGEKR